jgi:hypothetical protein
MCGSEGCCAKAWACAMALLATGTRSCQHTARRRTGKHCSRLRRLACLLLRCEETFLQLHVPSDDAATSAPACRHVPLYVYCFVVRAPPRLSTNTC